MIHSAYIQVQLLSSIFLSLGRATLRRELHTFAYSANEKQALGELCGATVQGESYLLNDIVVTVFSGFRVGTAPRHQMKPSTLTGHNNAAASWPG